MASHGQRRLSPARVLAPLALLVSVVAVVVIVLNFTSQQENSDGAERPSTNAGQRPTTTDTGRPNRPRRAAYRVKLNDTLGLIAQKTGVGIERLQELNPELDPQNLIVGQRIKLRE